ncbi:F0F1 ATP synthase subunit gamma [Patescibacteria group bacterium]|nr:F0F1 ATP synthase subunit gamma [Patescibacteria group bacterium]
MGDLKRLKAKIASTKNIKKITSALEIIATLKLQKTKKQTEFLRNYVDHLIPLLITIERQVDIFAKVRRRDSEQEEISKILPELHVVVSSEK